jgi:hypothetical protein
VGNHHLNLSLRTHYKIYTSPSLAIYASRALSFRFARTTATIRKQSVSIRQVTVFPGNRRYRIGRMRFKALVITALVVSLALLPLLGNPKSVALEVTYLGNEGFLVRSGSQAVLFDPLFGEGLADYEHVPEQALRNMEAGRPPLPTLAWSSSVISTLTTLIFRVPSSFLCPHPQTIVLASNEVSQQLRRALSEKRRDPWQIPSPMRLIYFESPFSTSFPCVSSGDQFDPSRTG